MSKRRLLLSFIMSGIRRFPFWEALSLMMLFGEMESKQKRRMPFPLQLIYIDVGLLVLLGTFMSFNSHWKRPCAIIAAVQMVIHSVFEFQYHNMKEQILMHVLLRNIGVIGSYFLIAAGVGEDRKARRSGMIQLSYFVFGIMLAFQGYLIATSEFEQSLLKNIVPKPVNSSSILSIMIPLLTICLSIASYCFIVQKPIMRRAMYFALVYVLCIFVPLDFSVLRWKYKPELWTCLRLLASSVTTLGGITALSLCENYN